jgi:protein TonB
MSSTQPTRARPPSGGEDLWLPAADWSASSRRGLVAGVVATVLTHVGGLQALAALADAERADDGVSPAPTTTYEVAVVDPPSPVPEPLVEDAAEEPLPAPEDAPEPLADSELEPSSEPSQDADAAEADPYAESAPAAGEASDVMTADGAEAVDMTGEGWDIVDGKGTGASYGRVSAKGTARKPTFNRGAKVGGKVGGKGSGRGSTRGSVDRSQPAGLVGGSAWSCPFPPEADASQINRATAVVVVTVSPAGRASAVSIVSDPGYGFGRAARQCASGRTYRPALDRDGTPTTATTPPIVVRFRR